MSYGNYFTNNFTKKYTEKYWSIPLKKLETKWLKFRMPKINIIDLLMGAFTKRFKNTFYGSNLRYPKKGGYESFLRILKSNKNILTNSEVEKIEVKKNKITLKNKKIYYYKYLISTLPLIEIVKKIDKVPTKVKKSTSKLNYTSGVLVSICLNKKIKFRPWFYVYDKDIPFARAHSPSEKSRFNAPKKCSSLQLEIYFNKKNNEKTHLSRLKDKAIKSILKMNLFNLKDIMYVDVRKVEYANIIFDHNVYKAKSHVLEYLKKNNIVGAGRFGEWKYLWSNEAFLSGKNAASKVFKKIKA